MNKRYMKWNKFHTLLLNTAVLLLLFLGSTGAWARDYVLSYTNGGTTYYVGMNGNSLAVKTTFDLTCIWTCMNGNNEANLGGTSYSLRNKNNNRYYLTTSCDRNLTWGGYNYSWDALSVQTSASNMWRSSNGTNGYVYAYYSTGGWNSWNREASLRVVNSAWAMYDDNTTGSQNYQVTTTTVDTSIGTLTINDPASELNHTGTYNFSHNTPTYQIGGYLNYSFDNADHYFDTNGNSITPAAATVSGYTWAISNNPYATINSDGVVTVNSLPDTDQIVTITLTANVTGGTPAVPAGTTLTATKEVTIYGTTLTKPNIAVSGSTATITTNDPGTISMYYTLDGSTPTTTNGTLYSGAIDLSSSTTSPVTIKAIAVRGEAVSEVSTKEVKLTLPTPTINVDVAAGTASISSVDGATIYYTTDGSEPSTSSTKYTGSLSGLSAMATVKAIAVKEGWNNSAVASEQVLIPSGVSGGTVTLFDYEDHNWIYYQSSSNLPTGYPTDYLSSPDPRNVKITYRGGSVSGASAVAISALDGEGQNEMVYYKTLEKSVPGMTGNYPYTVISNPFSKRPATGSGNNKTYYGFAGWKVISGGEYISEYANNATLPLDATIHFTNLDNNYTPNCTSAEIVFEATWTTARVQTGYQNITFTGGTYETNFWVLQRNQDINNITVPANCTVSARYPDGTVNFTRNITGTITAGGNNAKVEFVNMNSTGNVSAANYTFTMGRGIVNSNNGGDLQGCTTNANCNQTVKIESGTYNTLHNFTSELNAARSCDQLMILGCDYDRAKGDNNKLFIRGEMYVGTGIQLNRSANSLYTRTYIKSGNLGSTVTVGNGYTGSGGDQTYYFSVGNTHNAGRRYLCVEGGRLMGIAGGMDETNNQTTTARGFDLRVRGTAQIDGVVYGAAEFANARGIRTMVFTGGSVGGWIAGGANGTQSTNGALTGATYLYVGGKTNVDSNNSRLVLNRAVGGNVFGAGCGYSSASSSGQVLNYNTNVVVADESYIERGVYGGGSYGYTTQTSNIFVLGGTVDGKSGGVNGTSYSADITGGVFGGACQNRGGTVNIYMNGGEVHGGVYGGSNANGTISGDVTMNINGGQVGTSSQAANIHGGGYGSSTVVDGWVTLTLGQEGQTEGGVTVYGDVYGGSALGEVNGTDADPTYYTRVTLNKGVINGSLYGGGLGNNTYAADVNGPVIVTVNGGSVKTTAADGSGAVYGCNNISGAPQRSVTVIINGTDPAPDENTYALDAVYGGGNKADYSSGTPTVTVNNCDNSIAYVYGGGNAAHITNGDTDVTIHGGNKIGTVFGGGNGTVTPANVHGDTNVKIYGGTIGQVFGGSNSQGTIGGTINVTIQKSGSCAMHIDEVYGGGNMAASNAGNLTIGCTGNEGEGIGDVYGGANAADITGNIALNITGGSINRVFGGNNASGSISGTIQVDVNWNSTCGYNYLGSVFGGGNQAAYGNAGQNKGNYPVVNIFNGTVSENVFGGGLGATAIVYGNPQVTIGDATAEHKAIVKGDVYGGGDAAAVSGTPVVKVVNKCNTEIGNVYGGGNAADVTATNVTINGGTVKGDVYGGGHGDKSADVSANVNGNVSLNVTGGTINRVFGGSNSQGNISGTINVNINKGNESCDMKIGEVYGGGNEAAGNAGSITIGCTGTPALSTIDATHRLGYELEGIGDVYGGANAADIGTSGAHSDITLNIQGGAINRVFGGNNTSGTIYGDIEVNIDWSGSCTNYLYDVFGCGNVADYSGSSTVNLINGDVSHCVYGGGNEADAGTAATYIKGGTVASGVYGGCNTSGTATGDITVGVTGGTIGTSSARANVHGGGYGSATASEGNVTVSIGTTSGGVNSGTGVIYGDVYGGSALGNVNSDTSDNTNVNLLSGTVHGDVYGGGLGDSENAALVKGNVVVKLNEGVTTTKGCIVDGRIFGCNNANGTPQGLVTVYVYATQKADKANVAEKADKGSGTFDVQAVYGGGNQAAYQPTNLETGKSKVVINGCGLTSIGYVYGGGNAASSPATEVEVNGSYEIDYVFGGGNGKDALPNGDENPGAHVGYLTWEEGSASNVAYGTGIATTNLYGGTINHVFGGSNTKGNVREVAVAMLDEGGDCDLVIEEIYGGGNEAYMEGKGSINLGCVTYMKEVYGGAKNAPVGNDVELTITSGHFDRVFGGNNIGGAINGSITVNIEETGCNPITIGELYGCGNAAAYTTPAGKSQPTINIKSCTSIGRVFGGGFGSTAGVTGSPVVNINEVVGENSTETSTYAGTTRTLKDGTTVTLPPHTSGAIGAIGTVYGGGNAAQVTGNTTVHIGTQPTISYVSGNDHAAKTVVGANITGNVFGGGLGSSAVVTGNTDVVIGK